MSARLPLDIGLRVGTETEQVLGPVWNTRAPAAHGGSLVGNRSRRAIPAPVSEGAAVGRCCGYRSTSLREVLRRVEREQLVGAADAVRGRPRQLPRTTSASWTDSRRRSSIVSLLTPGSIRDTATTPPSGPNAPTCESGATAAPSAATLSRRHLAGSHATAVAVPFATLSLGVVPLPRGTLSAPAVELVVVGVRVSTLRLPAVDPRSGVGPGSCHRH
jgi:hypothetical protein